MIVNQIELANLSKAGSPFARKNGISNMRTQRANIKLVVTKRPQHIISGYAYSIDLIVKKASESKPYDLHRRFAYGSIYLV